MISIKGFMSGCRLFLVLGFILSGLAIVAVGAPASASTAPGHTIATAGALKTTDSASGGGALIDFWKIKLNGGDVVRFDAAMSTTNGEFAFELFASGTTDENFRTAKWFASYDILGKEKSVFTLQAPYNGTFVLAVCEDTINACPMVDSGGGLNPMNPYAFTTSLATGDSAALAAKEVQASATIAGAPKLALGNFEAGGGKPTDFWKVHLNGGGVVRFEAATSTPRELAFQLFAPGTTDESYPDALWFASYDLREDEKAAFTLQAPYNGTFILAVCEGTDDDCPSMVGVSDMGLNPMSPYAFTTSLATGVSAAVAAKEVRASSTIAGARKLALGHFEAGGAGPIDFWKVHLNGGDMLRFEATTSTTGEFAFQLFPPGTNDANFPKATWVSNDDTRGEEKTALTLRAPYKGTFVLAVCEDTDDDCSSLDSDGVGISMDPYTFTTRLTGGFETRTALTLAAASVKYGHEKGFRFTVRVSAIFGGSVTGKVAISDGRKTVCTAKVVRGNGFCTLSSRTKIPVGKYTITGIYSGNRDSSKSGGYTLKVTG